MDIMSHMFCTRIRKKKHSHNSILEYVGLKEIQQTSTMTIASSISVTKSQKSSTSIPKVNRSLQGHDTITVVVKRGRHGYGFTVMGSCPVTIGKVDEGSQADSAILKKGDNIVRINGQNVSRSTADSVAKIIKNSPKQVILDVVRSQLPLQSSVSLRPEGMSACESMSSCSKYEPLLSVYQAFPSNPYTNPASICSSRSSTYKKTPVDGTPASLRGLHDTLPLRPSQFEKFSSSESSRRSTSRKYSYSRGSLRGNTCKEGIENVVWSKSSSSHKLRNHSSSHKVTKSSVVEVTAQSAFVNDYDSLRWDATNEEIFFNENEDIFDELPWKPFDCDLKKVASPSEYTYATMHDDQTFLDIAFQDESDVLPVDESHMSMNDCAHTTLPEVSVSFCDLSRRERARQEAAGQLVLAEAEFIKQMQYGIQRYSRPLRHCIMSAQEHRILFQNVEKLVAFSEYHMRQMENNSQPYNDLTSTSERYVDVIGDVYRQRAVILCEAYQLYSQGLQEALKLLDDLRTYEQFYTFLSEPAPKGDEPSIEDFLRKPVEHLGSLMVTLRTVLSHTSSVHHDADALQQVVQAFNSCCTKESFPANDTSNSSSSFSSMSSGRSGSSSASKSSSASIDSELVEIQERIVFPKDIPAFQLATPSRHVIYTSEMLRVESCVWVRVVVILLSDMLLITRLDGDSLIVVDDPLPLPDVMNSTFGGSHPCEFTLTAEVQNSGDLSWEARHILLRAPSMEQACTWKSLLEQRIASFRTHRELMSGRSREAVF